jgi:hypothetical protein
MNSDTLKGFALSALVSAAVSFGITHYASGTQMAQPRPAEGQLAPPPGTPLADEPRGAPAEDSSAIREAHSDGGYWYWMDAQRAMP